MVPSSMTYAHSNNSNVDYHRWYFHQKETAACAWKETEHRYLKSQNASKAHTFAFKNPKAQIQWMRVRMKIAFHLLLLLLSLQPSATFQWKLFIKFFLFFFSQRGTKLLEKRSLFLTKSNNNCRKRKCKVLVLLLYFAQTTIVQKLH